MGEAELIKQCMRGVNAARKELYDTYAEQMLSKGHKWDVVSNIFDSLGNVFYDIKPNDDFEYVQIIGRSNNNRTYKWIRKEYIKDDETLMTL